MSESSTATVARMKLPPPCGAVFIVCLTLFVFFFIAVSIFDLVNFSSMPPVAVIASVAWLAFVALLFVASIRGEGGIRQWLINQLGVFSKRQFVMADATNGRSLKIRFGYKIVNREFYYLEIDGSAIVSVDWGTGQATAMMGRDMNDWHVALWHQHPRGTQYPHYPGVRNEEVYIVGPFGRKDEIDAFGRKFVEFLRKSGVELRRTDDPTEFEVVASPPAN